MNGNILLKLTVFVIYRFIDRLCRQTFGKSALDCLIWRIQGKDLMDLQDQAVDSGLLQVDYRKLLEKLCKLTGKTPLEIFLLARDEKGFGWSDENVEKHLSIYIKSGCQELPNYVEVFLDDGKKHIIDA
jgi:hypothetical protein